MLILGSLQIILFHVYEIVISRSNDPKGKPNQSNKYGNIFHIFYVFSQLAFSFRVPFNYKRRKEARPSIFAQRAKKKKAEKTTTEEPQYPFHETV